MTARDLRQILVLLQRTTVQGSEVEMFVELVNKIEKAYEAAQTEEAN